MVEPPLRCRFAIFCSTCMRPPTFASSLAILDVHAGPQLGCLGTLTTQALPVLPCTAVAVRILDLLLVPHNTLPKLLVRRYLPPIIVAISTFISRRLCRGLRQVTPTL